MRQTTPTEKTSSGELDERVTRRAHGPKYQIYAFRGTPAQKALLDYAASESRLSRQQILNRLVWRALEEKYGDKVAIEQEGHND